MTDITTTQVSVQDDGTTLVIRHKGEAGVKKTHVIVYLPKRGRTSQAGLVWVQQGLPGIAPSKEISTER